MAQAVGSAEAWRPPPALRGFFGGAGMDLIGLPEAVSTVIGLSGKAT
eukprot:CAMPEP_0204534788 /NCGR_PEP_ID=MMETSP0661-20131031/13226_1 /ASSEMBLY_ACC=CAM_ASM_000606 /TAXON_ID=109239 /ORGANISM="Alexandrium margalefi, Strain AMGDE01CS-322" /LENGTH=46 /DNA_ID= /DNA_START= /DNA_END= /DNA_ORIENTATION=